MKLTLCRTYAKTAIELYFRNEKQVENLKTSLVKVENSYPNCEAIALLRLKIKARIIKINREAVERVFNRLSLNKREFVVLKYDKLVKDTAIVMRLSLPIPTLQRWNNEVLHEVEMEILGKVDFKRLIIRCDELDEMIKELDEDIAFFEGISVVIDIDYLERLKRKKVQLQQFADVVNSNLRYLSSNERKIVTLKFFGGILTDEEVAAQCNVSQSLVRTYCVSFRNGVFKIMKLIEHEERGQEQLIANG